MEKIVSLCKRRGFIFQSSEVYGELNGAWDYGPFGVELKKNLKDFWWRRAALVSTVPLNAKSHGNGYRTADTLAICEMLIDDREDMVVKALSWALRVLGARAMGRLVAAGAGPEASRRLTASATQDAYALVRQAALESLA